VDDNKVMVALAADGNIIAGTNYGTEQAGDNHYAVVKIMKIAPDGTIIWNHNYLDPGYDNVLLNTLVLNSGNIITSGGVTRFDSGPNRVSWILCTDSLGNQLWYKEYALLTGDNSFNRLYDVRETPDGGLIGCGMGGSDCTRYGHRRYMGNEDGQHGLFGGGLRYRGGCSGKKRFATRCLQTLSQPGKREFHRGIASTGKKGVFVFGV